MGIVKGNKEIMKSVPIAEDLEGEVWVEVKPDIEYVNPLRVYVSNFGRVKTDTHVAKGRLLRGSTLEGYKAYHFRYFKPRKPEVVERLKSLKSQMALLKEELREAVKKRIYEGRKPGRDEREIKSRIESIRRVYYKEKRADEVKRIVHVTYIAHRVVAELFLKRPSPDHKIVIHLDYNKLNNHMDNLKWVTQEEATLHHQKSPAVIAGKALRKGKRAEKSKVHKLTPAQVSLIKKHLQEGNITIAKLARQFKITQTQLKRIQNGENWGDVEPAK